MADAKIKGIEVQTREFKKILLTRKPHKNRNEYCTGTHEKEEKKTS